MKKYIILAGILVVILVVLLVYANRNTGRVADISSFDVKHLESYHMENQDEDSLFLPLENALNRFLWSEGIVGGASVAISYKGRMVYAKGLGFSNLEDSSQMQPYNLLRIASVSKLVTAIAVMRLVEDGRLGLQDKVFGLNGILSDDDYIYFKDKRMGEVTVYQLLNHSGGWTARWGDPMFMPVSIANQMGLSLPISMRDIIHFMQSKHLHFQPGTGSVYSNFGYGILGEVVQKVARMPYEDYVRSEVLMPLGIYDMRLGYSHREDRLANEVVYYETDTSEVFQDCFTGEPLRRRAYGVTDIHTLGSAGGWVSSVTDLLKLVLTVDGFTTVPDQLIEFTIQTMTDHEPGFDPIGWRTTIDDSWYRTGTLAATSAIIGRLPNEVCYVVILNCSNYHGPVLATMLRNCMNRVIEKMDSFPKVDLLEEDASWQSWKRYH